jgi:hypothetical protein
MIGSGVGGIGIAVSAATIALMVVGLIALLVR